MSELADAWLLDLGRDRFAAVGRNELQEVLVAPPLTPLLATPAHCRYSVNWRGVELPVMDLAAIFGAIVEDQPPHWLTIAAYRDPVDLQPRFGALQLAAPPIAIQVSDDSACPIPETSLPEYLAWSYLSLCCFHHDDRVIPILNVPLLFSPEARQRLQRYSMPPAISEPNQAAHHLEGTT